MKPMTIEERLDRIERTLGIGRPKEHDAVQWQVALSRLRAGDRTLFDRYLDEHGGDVPPTYPLGRQGA